MSEIIENEIKITIVGYDEYGRFQHETLLVTDKTVATKYAYASIGLNLPADFIAKIGAWFWK